MLVSSKVVAERLGTTEQHVRYLRNRGELPWVQVGRLVRFDITAIDDYIRANTITANAS